MTLVERPDLSRRTALSKSVLTTFDLCETKVWNGIHDPRPFIPVEKVTFGSAVDAGVEVIVKSLSSGQPIDLHRAFAAAAEVVTRDDVELQFGQVEDAIGAFDGQVGQHFDWARAVTQSHLSGVHPQLGNVDGHPDIIMADGSVWDVKTSARAKEVPSLELGFYALLTEMLSGQPTPTVGYMTWVRVKRPYWQVAGVPVNDRLRDWAYEKAAAYVRARDMDARINAKTANPGNYTMAGGPRFDGLCRDCPWNPALGGTCRIAMQEDSDDHAA